MPQTPESTFKLFALPDVPLRHVLKMMGPGGVFILTLFFPKCRWIAESIFPRVNPSLLVDYCGENNEATLIMKILPKQVPMLRWNFRTKKYFLKERKINREIFRCCFDFNSNLSTPLIIFSAQDNDRWWEIISSHFFQMLPIIKGSHVAVTANTISNIPTNRKVDLFEFKPGSYREL